MSLEEPGVQPTLACPFDLWLSSSGEAKEDDDSIWSLEEIGDHQVQAGSLASTSTSDSEQCLNVDQIESWVQCWCLLSKSVDKS